MYSDDSSHSLRVIYINKNKKTRVQLQILENPTADMKVVRQSSNDIML